MKYPLAYVLGSLTTVFSVNLVSTDFYIPSYKFSLPFLLLFLVFNIRIKFNLKLLLYIVFFLYASIISIFFQIELKNGLTLTDNDVNNLNYHSFTQFVQVIVFTSTYLIISNTSANTDWLRQFIIGYLGIIIFHIVIASSMLTLNLLGLWEFTQENEIGIPKLVGLSGEPKQFAALMLTGILLLKFGLKGMIFPIINKVNNKRLQIIMGISILGSFSTAGISCLLILIISDYLIKYKRIFYTLILTLFILIIGVVSNKNLCEKDRDDMRVGEGFQTIYQKISSIETIISYLPKDGIVIVDFTCKPSEYIFGGGAGSLYRKIMQNDISNTAWFRKIELISDSMDGKTNIYIAPSTMQIQLISDFGLIGALIFFAFLLKTERFIEVKSDDISKITLFLLIFWNSQTYLWILLLMYFITLRIKKNELEKL